MINKVILIGNVGIAPEIRTLESGVRMARLRVATTERFYNSTTGERKEHTEWHTVTLWRSQADFAERYIQKGTQIYVEGRIRSREVIDSITGNRRIFIEIHADDIKTLGRRPQSTGNEQNADRSEQEEIETPIIPNPDNLPF